MKATFFFFNDTATTEIYTLSLHDALPILTGNGSYTISNYRIDPPSVAGGANLNGASLIVFFGGGSLSSRSEEHTSELQSPCNLVCRLLLEKKKKRHMMMDVRSVAVVVR